MDKKDIFNPIKTSLKLKESYRSYIAATIHFDNESYQRQLESILDQNGFLAKGPFLEAAPPYRKGATVRDLIKEGVLCESMASLAGGDASVFDLDRPLYTHQERAIRKANAGYNYAVVTGTGSGKTECFLLPIINDILKEFEASGKKSGVRALLLYPMNALANDQLKRLRSLLKGTDITFGRYTGDTDKRRVDALEDWAKDNPGQILSPNEMISREEIRKNPPNILLTNYSMLEYLLLRPKDAPLFGPVFGKNWRHIAIDEAHVYSGSLGTEIAFLLRRLKARIGAETGVTPHPHCYATSATIGSTEQIPLVAKFAEDLFGEPFDSTGDNLAVITSDADETERYLPDQPWGVIPLDSWVEMAQFLDKGRDDEALNVLSEYVEIGYDNSIPVLQRLGAALLGEANVQALVRLVTNDILDLTDLSQISSLGIEGLTSDEAGIKCLAAMVEVLSRAQRSEDVPLLSCRYHSFLRAPEGIFIDLFHQKLMGNRTVGIPYDNSKNARDGDDCVSMVPVYEASVCRHCGQAYILGTDDGDGWLNPRHKGSYADEEYMPHRYYRLVQDDENVDEVDNLLWLCPICGSVQASQDGHRHRFEHESVKLVPISETSSDEENSKCTHCGYSSPNAIQPMRVSPEAAGSVVCYDLARELPPFGDPVIESDGDDWSDAFDEVEKPKAGNIICFSDRRQDAAYFAPAMERTYKQITKRQLIREAVVELESNGEGIYLDSIVSWLASEVQGRYEHVACSEEDAKAWVLDELVAQDQRNSLNGLGVVRFLPSGFNRGFDAPRIVDEINNRVAQLNIHGVAWITPEDYRCLALYCLDTLRASNCVHENAGIKGKRTSKGYARFFVANGNGGEERNIDFCGRPTGSENRRSRFIRKYAHVVHGDEIDREQATSVLGDVFSFLTNYLKAINGKKLVGYKPTLYWEGTKFCLETGIWKAYAIKQNDKLYICNKCGCMSNHHYGGVCPTDRCEGLLEEKTFEQVIDKDRYYKDIYREQALPLRIEEHTAQLSTDRARSIQAEFIDGKVNVLSCTTTFELGVDVGDLRGIFMRNVPPKIANYTQRAGRVGRRAGKPGYAVTFAKLRPHDVNYFNNPKSMIGGKTDAPSCYLDNPLIARRHLNAIALSEFFRTEESIEKDRVNKFNSFMALDEEEPQGLVELRSLLSKRPNSLAQQVDLTFGFSSALESELGISSWEWADTLTASFGSEDMRPWSLVRPHSYRRSDYLRLLDEAKATDDHGKKASLSKSIQQLQLEETIGVLAGSGILPKYGFPTDVVELRLPDTDTMGKKVYELQRGLRQAIVEYAPGSKVVAGKRLWKSYAIKKSWNHKLQERSYGTCPNCRLFFAPIDNLTDKAICPNCNKEVSVWKKMLIPEYGFVGKRDDSKGNRNGIVRGRPESCGYGEIHFTQIWENEIQVDPYVMDNCEVVCRWAPNAQLFAINTGVPEKKSPTGRSGFWVCPCCGGAGTSQDAVEHAYGFPCAEEGSTYNPKSYQALGTGFTSDILELAFNFHTGDNIVEEQSDSEIDAVASTMWAIHTAAIRILEVPDTELGVISYAPKTNGFTILFFDNVPGGAGHTLKISGMIPQLLHRALEVASSCDCDEKTCCYGCIANYSNQRVQHKLSRGAAKAVLERVLAESTQEASFTDEGSCNSGIDLTPDFIGADVSAVSFSEACGYANGICSTEQDRRFISVLGECGEHENVERPHTEVTFYSSDGKEADALLAWEDAHILVLGEDSLQEFAAAFGDISAGIKGWTTYRASVDSVAQIIEQLKECRWQG